MGKATTTLSKEEQKLEKQRKKDEEKRLKEEKKKQKKMDKEAKKLGKSPSKFGSTLSSMSPASKRQSTALVIDMPEDVINRKFEELLDSMGANAEARETYLKYSMTVKYSLIKNKEVAEQAVNDMEHGHSPSVMITKLNSNFDKKTLQDVEISLRTKPINWVDTFINCGGIEAVASVLASTNIMSSNKDKVDFDTQSLCVSCFRAILNTDVSCRTTRLQTL